MRGFTVAADADDFIDAARRHLGHNGGLAIHAGDATCIAHGRAAEAVLTLLDALANGRYFDITVLPEVLTAGQAAALLDVSSRNVRALIERGEVPAIETDSHPGIRTVDLMAFAEDQRLARAEAMSELVRISEELGLYDIE